MKPHKHAELIKAWADGAEIEVLDVLDQWINVNDKWAHYQNAFWYENMEYRIKPEPKPDIVRYAFISTRSCDAVTEKQYNLDNIKLTFDGETGELKSAEVLN